jgi:small conductance mechanosensitive channel
MDPTLFVQSAIPWVTLFVLKVIGAVVVWVIGRKLISLTARLVVRSLRYPFDPTVAAYIGTAVSVVLTITLILALLGFFGIETTSFAALLAGVGLAIGAAWSGLLANLAAGIFLLILRPFKVGDFIAGGGVTGTVNDIGLFVTCITTPDNVRTFVGNNKLFADNIQNFSANPYRRVDLLAQLDHRVDPAQAIRLLKQRLAAIPNVTTDPTADVEILTFTPMGPVLAVRPYCNNAHYWQVYFDTNRVIRETFGEAGFPAPEQHFAVRSEARNGGEDRGSAAPARTELESQR